MTRTLDADLLSRLRDAVADLTAEPLVASRNGRSAHAIRAAFATIGLEPPDEALLWWGAFDGWSDRERFEVVPGLQGATLADAVGAYRALRGSAEEFAAEYDAVEELQDPDAWWHRAWVPIFFTGGMQKIAADFSAPGDGTVAIRVVDPAETGQPQHGSVIAASLGQLIERAVTALERGTFSYDRDQAMWNPILPWPWILDAG